MLRQIVDLLATYKSRYFAIAEFNNCLTIRSRSLFSNEYLHDAKRSAIFTQERSLKEQEQNIICSQTQLDDIAPEQTIVCRQLFAAHMVGSRPVKRKKNCIE